MVRQLAVGMPIMNAQQVGTKALLGLSIAVLAGGAAMALRQTYRRAPAYRVSYPHVRDAGPANMKDPPREWDTVDEMMDQTFPASDPPAYCGPARFK
jgi:hypothetical protein